MREMEFPGALVTITEISLGEKLETGKVKVSVLPNDAVPQVMKQLAENSGRLKGLLSKKVNMRIMPKLHFELDRGFENAAAVEKALLEAGEGDAEQGE